MKSKVLGLVLSSALSLNVATLAMSLESYSKENSAQIENGPVVLAFHSASCGTCKRQKPVLDAIMQEASFSNMKALSVDFDTEKDLRKRYRVNSSSTIVVLKDGKEVARSIGESEADDIRKTISKGFM
jgi:thiol-disulfide isomerase/thioredoxin